MKDYTNISPRIFTLSAFTVGFLLIDNLSTYEQNALGSWFMLLGQTLCTNSSVHMVKEERSTNGNINPNDLLNKASQAISKEANKYK